MPLSAGLDRKRQRDSLRSSEGNLPSISLAFVEAELVLLSAAKLHVRQLLA